MWKLSLIKPIVIHQVVSGLVTSQYKPPRGPIFIRTIKKHQCPTDLCLPWQEKTDNLASSPNSWSQYRVTSWSSTCSTALLNHGLLKHQWDHGCSKAKYAFLCFHNFCFVHCVLLRRLFKSWAGVTRAQEKNKRSWKHCGGQAAVKRSGHNQECSW